jgi:hypothetical protein
MFAHAKALPASGKSFVATAAEIGIGRGPVAKWIRDGSFAGSSPSDAEAEFATLFPGVSCPTVGRGRQDRPPTISRRSKSRLHGQPLPFGAPSFRMAARRTSRNKPTERAGERRARYRSRNGLANLSPRRGRSLHEADPHAYRFSGRQGHCMKEASPSFVIMRRLARRFRGLLRGVDPDKLLSWLDDVRIRAFMPYSSSRGHWPSTSTPSGMLSPKPWSSDQAEGQNNRFKTLKRAMFGRAGIELLRARMLPSNKSISPESDEDPAKIAPVTRLDDRHRAQACDATKREFGLIRRGR